MNYFTGKIAITMTLLSVFPCYAATPNDIKTIISKADTFAEEIDQMKDIAQFIPYDMYSQAIIDIIFARNLLEEGKLLEANFYANAGYIRFQAAVLIGETKKLRYQKIEHNQGLKKGPCNSAIVDINSMINARFIKKGPYYSTYILDRHLFANIKGNESLNINSIGKQRLTHIIKAMKENPEANIKIVGHTDYNDYKGYSLQKAKAVGLFLIQNGISQNRIKTFGLGNKEVIETYQGYRRVSRVELILSGLTDLE
jgi:hypothetical protein